MYSRLRLIATSREAKRRLQLSRVERNWEMQTRCNYQEHAIIQSAINTQSRLYIHMR